MGVGPAVAIPAAVKAAGLELDDIDLFEINEVNSIYFHDLLLTRYLVPHPGVLILVCSGICISVFVLP